LEESKIGNKLGEQIALAVAETNQCEYCLSAHTVIGGKLLHIDEATLTASRTAETSDAKANAALTFAQTLVQKKGLVNDSDVAAVRGAGFTEGELAEIVAHTALNILTNYFNNTANTAIDFPKVSLLAETL
jgi:alkylhydroperoxidase family enzyme